MGNSRSASFEVDHLPGDTTPTKQSRKRYSFNGENQSEYLKQYEVPRPKSMHGDMYAESSVSEHSSKESETISTLSTSSTAENIPSLADRYKTAPSRLSIPGLNAEDIPNTDGRKTKSMHHHASPESFFDAIFATIEQEAGKKSPSPPRRRTQTMAASKKRWSSMFS